MDMMQPIILYGFPGSNKNAEYTLNQPINKRVVKYAMEIEDIEYPRPS